MVIVCEQPLDGIIALLHYVGKRWGVDIMIEMLPL